jgi:hypothetical protein
MNFLPIFLLCILSVANAAYEKTNELSRRSPGTTKKPTATSSANAKLSANAKQSANCLQKRKGVSLYRRGVGCSIFLALSDDTNDAEEESEESIEAAAVVPQLPVYMVDAECRGDVCSRPHTQVVEKLHQPVAVGPQNPGSKISVEATDAQNESPKIL